MVAKPMVEYLLNNNFSVKIASPMKDRAEKMISGNPNGTSADWSMDDISSLENYINESNITVSLLPYKYHTDVAKVCLKYKKPLVTTSYVQPEMQALDKDAKNNGVIFLNEIGLDPGIDHMSAMKIIDYIHGKNGSVDGFYSLCGALPAPETIDNPLGYKFSWSPKGVILASRNSAVYLKNGRKIFVEPINLFRDSFTYFFPEVGELDVYPNRDSISYISIYGIPETSTMYRGTFRYKEWCRTLDAIKHLNMLDDTVLDYSNMDYNGFLSERSSSRGSRKDIAAKLGINEKIACD